MTSIPGIEKGLLQVRGLVHRSNSVALIGEHAQIFRSVVRMMPSEKDFTYPTLQQAFLHHRLSTSESPRLRFERAVINPTFDSPGDSFNLDNLRGVFYPGRSKGTKFGGQHGTRWGWGWICSSGFFILEMKVTKVIEPLGEIHALTKINLHLSNPEELLDRFMKQFQLSEFLLPFYDQVEFWRQGLQERMATIEGIKNQQAIIDGVLKISESR